MAMDTKVFFSSLAERLFKENALSDMTYALCQSDKAFKQFFLDFFFDDVVADDKVEIEREKAFEAGRPDFCIHVGKKVYLVEVKKWDRSQHFAQYQSILSQEMPSENPIGHLGYIANYKIDKGTLSEKDAQAYEVVCADGKTVKTWKEFVLKLERYSALNDPLIQGYLDYVRSVCPFDDFDLPKDTSINLLDFKYVGDFIRGLDGKIKGMDMVEKVSSADEFSSQNCMGLFFKIEKAVNEKDDIGWIGANYTQDGAIVFVEFQNKPGWGELVCDKFRYDLQSKDSLCFYLKDDARHYLRDISVEKINNFLEQVIDFVRSDDKALPACACLSRDHALKIRPLLAMKWELYTLVS